MDPMIANTLLLSESRALAWLYNHPGAALISIRDTDASPGPLPCTPLGPRLDLRFDDLSLRAKCREQGSPPSRADAQAIVAFARVLAARPWPPGLVVHCAAGISRSAAALIGVTRVIGGSDEVALALFASIVHRTRERGLRVCDPMPNRLLLALLDRELDLRGSLVRAVHQARLVIGSRSMAEDSIAEAASEDP